MTSLLPTDEFLHAMNDKKNFLGLATALYGAVLFDLIIRAPEEVRYVFWPELKALYIKREIPRIPTLLLQAVPFITLSYIFFVGQPRSCSAVWTSLCILYSLSTANAMGIFIVRTAAIRGSRWPLITFLVGCLIAQMIVWLYWASLAKAIQVTSLHFNMATCQAIIGLPEWTYVMYATLAVFDALILALCLQPRVNEVQEHGLKASWTTWTSEDSILPSELYAGTVGFSSATVCVVFIETIWVYIHRQNQLYMATVTPIHFFVTCTIAPRTIRRIKLHSARFGILSSIGSFGQPNHFKDLDEHRVMPIKEEEGEEETADRTLQEHTPQAPIQRSSFLPSNDRSASDNQYCPAQARQQRNGVFFAHYGSEHRIDDARAEPYRLRHQQSWSSSPGKSLSPSEQYTSQDG